MTVSKTLRFEVMRRDGFRCVYCGLAASDETVLQVDHVVPVALGGTDDPLNLVAACQECNAGKSATLAGADLQVVDALVQQLTAWRDANLIRLEALRAQQEIEEIEDTRRGIATQRRTSYRQDARRLLNAWEEHFPEWTPPGFFPLASCLEKAACSDMQALFDLLWSVLEEGETSRGPIPDPVNEPEFLVRYCFGVLRGMAQNMEARA